MKRFLAALVIVLVTCSVASAAWPYYGSYYAPGPVVVARPVLPPPPVVRYFPPVGPVYAYPPPVVAYRPSVVVAPPRAVYSPPVLVRPKTYVWGQPVRNVLRAVTP